MLAATTTAGMSQKYENRFERSVTDLMNDVQALWREVQVRQKRGHRRQDDALRRLPCAPLLAGNDARQHLQILRLELVEAKWQHV